MQTRLKTLSRTLLSASAAAFVAAGAGQAAAQQEHEQEASSADAETIDAIIAAVYDVISGPAGATRDWDRFRSLFADDARLMPTGTTPEGVTLAQAMTPAEYASLAQEGNWFAEGFFEKETGHVTECYGNIAHRFSSYAAYRSEADEEPFMRGINSFQLLNDGKRWQVLSIFWQNSADAGPIPAQYLAAGGSNSCPGPD